jgi:hypothetical protein
LRYCESNQQKDRSESGLFFRLKTRSFRVNMLTIRRCAFRYFALPVLGIRFPKSFTDRTIGVCLGPVVLVREDYWNDKATWLHELEHVKQTLIKGFVFHFVLYYFSGSYRCACEVQAYASELVDLENLHDQRAKLEKFSFVLFENYRLSQSRSQIAHLLQVSLEKQLSIKRTSRISCNS